MNFKYFKAFMITTIFALFMVGCSGATNIDDSEEEVVDVSKEENDPKDNPSPSSDNSNPANAEPEKTKDYYKSNEHKPVDEMTQDEIEQELTEITEEGPLLKSEEYNSNGEHKPVDQMTQEEIEKELTEMIGDSLGD